MSFRKIAAVSAAALIFVSHPLLTSSADVDLADPVAEGPAAGGAATTKDVIMEASGPWAVLASTRVGHPEQTRYCAATASADVFNPGACDDPVPAAQSFAFTLTLGNRNPVEGGGAERSLEFHNNDCPFGTDARSREVTTTRFFVVPPGRYRIFWLGRATGVQSGIVDDASITVVCTAERLPED